MQTSTRVKITKQGRQQIAAIRKDLKSIKKDDLTLDQIRARVAAAEDAFAAVLRNEIVPVGNVKEPAPADGADISDDPEAANGVMPSASESPTDQPSATASGSPTPEPTSSTASSSSPEPDPATSPSSSATPTASP